MENMTIVNNGITILTAIGAWFAAFYSAKYGPKYEKLQKTRIDAKNDEIKRLEKQLEEQSDTFYADLAIKFKAVHKIDVEEREKENEKLKVKIDSYEKDSELHEKKIEKLKLEYSENGAKLEENVIRLSKLSNLKDVVNEKQKSQIQELEIEKMNMVNSLQEELKIQTELNEMREQIISGLDDETESKDYHIKELEGYIKTKNAMIEELIKQSKFISQQKVLDFDSAVALIRSGVSPGETIARFAAGISDPTRKKENVENLKTGFKQFDE